MRVVELHAAAVQFDTGVLPIRWRAASADRLMEMAGVSKEYVHRVARGHGRCGRCFGVRLGKGRVDAGADWHLWFLHLLPAKSTNENDRSARRRAARSLQHGI